MADTVASASPGWRQRLLENLRLLYPAEGVVVVLLHLLMVVAAAWSVLGTSWSSGLEAVPIIAVAGALIGLLLAKAEAPDLAAHLTAFWLGLFVVVVHTIVSSPDLGNSAPERFRQLVLLFEDWSRSTTGGAHRDDHHLFIVLMGLTAWLVAYMSAWTLYRRGWVTAAVLLPGAVILINLGYRTTSGATPLVLYLVAAGTLVAAHFAYRRRQDWRHRGLTAPSFISSRMLGLGFNVVLIITILGWILPFNVRNDLLQTSWSAVDRPINTAAGQIESWLGDLTGAGRNRGASYTAFDDSFDLGGPIHLSDQPIVGLQPGSGTAPYLAARRLDYWDGHGWRSDADQTFDRSQQPDRSLSPHISYAPDQQVVLSDEVSGSRTDTSGTVNVISPVGDNLLFTRDTYLAADQPTSVVLSWRTFDHQALPIAGDADRAALPVDLRDIGRLLGSASFASNGDSPDVSDSDTARALAEQQKTLRQRGIDVGWTVKGGKATQLVISGQLPVYDDVTAVTSRTTLDVGSTYQVSGLASTATADDLRNAGTDYPSYVTDRYLQLPTTVTSRTRTLASGWVADAGATTPFDQAETIQNQVRDRISYTESPPTPPDNQDLVDYVLFDSQQGYCEYYASAMTVMLRSLHIPARVVTGFYPAAYDQGANKYIYREKNAHVWVEAFFPGYGWIPFEPTASQQPMTYGDTASTSPAPSPSTAAQVPPTPTPTTTEPSASVATTDLLPTPAPTVAATGANVQNDKGSSGGNGLSWFVVALAVLLMLIVAAVVAIALAWRRGLDGLDPTSALYARALRLGAWLGIRADPSMTPAEYAERFGQSIPSARRPARDVARAYTIEQYAAPVERPNSGRDGSAWQELRRAALRSLPGRLIPFRRRKP